MSESSMAAGTSEQQIAALREEIRRAVAGAGGSALPSPLWRSSSTWRTSSAARAHQVTHPKRNGRLADTLEGMLP